MDDTATMPQSRVPYRFNDLPMPASEVVSCFAASSGIHAVQMSSAIA